jgi:hypothetical protein
MAKDEFPEFKAIRRFWKALSKLELSYAAKQRVLAHLTTKLDEETFPAGVSPAPEA